MGIRTDCGTADTAEEKNRKEHHAQPVDGMAEEDHQALHLRYLDQHETHPDRAEIGHRRRQRRQRHPPRKTEEGQYDVVSAGKERGDDEQAGHTDRNIVGHCSPRIHVRQIAEAGSEEEERFVIRRCSDIFRQRIKECRVRLVGQ